ncbi:MAG: hypothetical protein AMXMBFR57_26990 [Acidimicrobiia bacterium]
MRTLNGVGGRVSPIYVRPAKEQIEHDRLIQFLEAQNKATFEVLINKGESRDYALKIGAGTYFPDLILQDGKSLAGVIEIETGESTNNLEALAQWVHFGKAKVPFSLYVPVLMYDAARRFCELNHVTVTEIWTYRPTWEGFELLRVFHDPDAVAKSGKGPMAKVAVMPKTVQAPRIEPVAELIEEVVRLGQKAEAARAARREAMRPSRVAIVKAAAAAAASKNAAAKAAEAAKDKDKAAAKPAAPAPEAKPPAKAAKAAAPAKGKAAPVPAKPVPAKAAAPKPAPVKPAAKAAPKVTAGPKVKPAAKAKPVAKAKPAPKPKPAAKSAKAKPVSKAKPASKARPAAAKPKPKAAAKPKAAKKKR